MNNLKLSKMACLMCEIYYILLKIIEGPILSTIAVMLLSRTYFENQFYDLA